MEDRTHNAVSLRKMLAAGIVAALLIETFSPMRFVGSLFPSWIPPESPQVESPGEYDPEALLRPLGEPDLARAAFPAVVSVVGDKGDSRISGTGFFISPAGLVATNRHVVEHSDVAYFVVTETGKRYEVVSMQKSDASDIALLRTTARNTPWLPIDSDEWAYPGQEIVALGAGAGRTVSEGIVVRHRNIVTIADEVSEEQKNQRNVVQIDAKVRPGSSGGPVINGEGEVIGIVFAFDPTVPSRGFALAAATIAELAGELLEHEYSLSANGMQDGFPQYHFAAQYEAAALHHAYGAQ